MAKRSQSDQLLRIGGIAFLAYLLFSGVASAAYSNLSFSRPRIRFGSISLSGVDATVSVQITNNNPAGLPLDNLLANIVYGPYILTTLTLQEPITIAANTTTELQFQTRLDFAQLGGNIAALITDGNFLQALRLTGTAYSNGIAFPFDNTISIG